MCLSIHVVPATFEMSGLGMVTGDIWICVGDEAIPERGWSDFPLPIQTWWIEATLALAAGHRTTVEWAFMDGPYELRLRRIGGPEWQATARQRRLKGVQDKDVGHVDGTQVLQDLCRSADATLAECQARGWQTSDVRSLARALRAARETLRG